MAQQNLEIKTNRIFRILEDSTFRIDSLRGGTRSGKTYNTLIWWIVRYLKCTGRTLTIARETMPALRGTTMRDFFEILTSLNLYSEANHNKTNNEYLLNGNLIEFIGLRESRRIRGRKRNDLFINEVNETTPEAFRQLAFRTTDRIVVDYNPSEPFSWVYDLIESRPDCQVTVSTYLDNPFLEQSVIDEIELLRETDDDYWRVYGLGEKAGGTSLIYTHWKETDWWPEEGSGERVIGIDFGYNNPTAIVEVCRYDSILYARQLLYESRLTTDDLIAKLGELDIRHVRIVADTAEPKTIEAIRREGYRIEGANKEVTPGIDFVKRNRLRIDTDSPDLLREIKRYSWKRDRQNPERLLDEPVKFDDHAMDALRYAARTFDQPEYGSLGFENLDRVSPYASFAV